MSSEELVQYQAEHFHQDQWANRIVSELVGFSWKCVTKATLLGPRPTLMFLQHSQQLELQRQRDIADLVQKPIGLAESNSAYHGGRRQSLALRCTGRPPGKGNRHDDQHHTCESDEQIPFQVNSPFTGNVFDPLNSVRR